MKLAIISDIHDNLQYLTSCITYCKKQKIEIVLCCGDITNNETVKKLGDFKIPVYTIRGNADIFDDKVISTVSLVHYLGRTGEVVLDNKKIGLCHEPFFFNDLLPNGYDVIFYGHTHKPWIETKEKTHIINPGALNGMPSSSTFAVWDTKKPLPELVKTSEIT